MMASSFLWYYQTMTIADLLLLTGAWAVVGLLVPYLILPDYHNDDKE